MKHFFILLAFVLSCFFGQSQTIEPDFVQLRKSSDQPLIKEKITFFQQNFHGVIKQIPILQ